jgi:uncharacterized protein YrrD
MDQLKMELKEGTSVFTTSGEEVGKINRFILDPTTNEVTHVVVQKGWLFTEDTVVPIDMIDSANEDKVVLKEDTGEFDKLPSFEETHYIGLGEEDYRPSGHLPYNRYTPAYYWYPPSGYIGYPGYGPGFYGGRPTVTTRNIPEDTVPIREGTDVMSSDDKHVGDVESIFVDSDSNQATHFVISQGLFFKDRKLVPAYWVTSAEEDKVHLSVPSRLLERLPSYEE